MEASIRVREASCINGSVLVYLGKAMYKLAVMPPGISWRPCR